MVGRRCAAAGENFSLGKNFNSPSARRHREPQKLILRQADTCCPCADLNVASHLIRKHLKILKLNLYKAFRLVHQLLTVDFNADLLKIMLGKRNDVTVAADVVGFRPVLVLVRGDDLHKEHLFTERGGIDPKISNVQHTLYLLSMYSDERRASFTL